MLNEKNSKFVSKIVLKGLGLIQKSEPFTIMALLGFMSVKYAKIRKLMLFSRISPIKS